MKSNKNSITTIFIYVGGYFVIGCLLGLAIYYIDIMLSVHKVSMAVKTKVEIVFINNNALSDYKFAVSDINTTYNATTDLYTSIVQVSNNYGTDRTIKIYSIIKDSRVLMTLDEIDLKSSLHIY